MTCSDGSSEVGRPTQTLREQRRAAGLCVTCGAVSANYYCDACSDKRAQDQAEKRRQRRWCKLCKTSGHVMRAHASMGLCIGCPVKSDQPKCAACIQRDVEHRRDLEEIKRKQRLRKGLCIRCGKRKIATKSASRCDPCLSYARDHAAKKSGHVRQKCALTGCDELARPRSEFCSRRHKLLARVDHDGVHTHRCGRCGRPGHHQTTCHRPARPIEAT